MCDMLCDERDCREGVGVGEINTSVAITTEEVAASYPAPASGDDPSPQRPPAVSGQQTARICVVSMSMSIERYTVGEVMLGFLEGRKDCDEEACKDNFCVVDGHRTSYLPVSFQAFCT